ncbi:hypothetical protein P692DRAFT_20128361 [Suillus brevipes Sb2]|nr:hypothetical protein P692DRAFT_20128361 [Suillus brevipes Sb2]
MMVCSDSEHPTTPTHRGSSTNNANSKCQLRSTGHRRVIWDFVFLHDNVHIVTGSLNGWAIAGSCGHLSWAPSGNRPASGSRHDVDNRHLKSGIRRNWGGIDAGFGACCCVSTFWDRFASGGRNWVRDKEGRLLLLLRISEYVPSGLWIQHETILHLRQFRMCFHQPLDGHSFNQRGRIHECVSST